MKPLGLIRQFHKLSRAFWFDLFGLIDLEILHFQFGSSTEILRVLKIETDELMDNVEIPDGKDPPVRILIISGVGNFIPISNHWKFSTGPELKL